MGHRRCIIKGENMGRNKTYKLDQNEKMMVEVFKNAIQENLHKQLYLISHEFKEVHTKDDYIIEAKLNYPKFSATIYYKPLYILSDFLDVKFDLGGKYECSIYDIFNLFEIPDFKQYYYSDIGIEENMNNGVKEIFDMINRYSSQIERAKEMLPQLESNIEADLKKAYGDDSWKEESDDESRIDICHPFFTHLNGAKNSDKLYKKMEKQHRKGKFTTIYEERLWKYLERGNMIVDDNAVSNSASDKSFVKVNAITLCSIIVPITLISAVLIYIRIYNNFSGAFMPVDGVTLGNIVIGLPAIVELAGCVVLLSVGIYNLFGKMIFKFFAKNDIASLQRFDKESNGKSVIKNKKAVKIISKIVGVFLVVISIIPVMIAGYDGIGFYDDYVKFYDYYSAELVQVQNKDLQFFKVQGFTDEEDENKFVEYENEYAKLIVFDGDKHYYVIADYTDKDGELQKRIDKILKENNGELKEVKTQEDFEEMYIPEWTAE